MRLFMLAVAMAATLSQAAVTQLSQADLKGYLENGAPFGFVLIDLRGSGEITAAIGNAQCKPYNLAWPEQFKKEISSIPKDQAIILYCQSGSRSRSAATYLMIRGYTHVYNAGGFMTWDGPTVPVSEMKPSSLLPELSMRAKQ